MYVHTHIHTHTKLSVAVAGLGGVVSVRGKVIALLFFTFSY